MREKIHSLLSFYHIRFEKRSSPSNKWIISQFGQLRDRQKKKILKSKLAREHEMYSTLDRYWRVLIVP